MLTDVGTGVVHTASRFGEDDYEVAEEINVEVFAQMNDERRCIQTVNKRQSPSCKQLETKIARN
jgi:isoleucyl-tRNA synthetase